jgi:hypothetical protein
MHEQSFTDLLTMTGEVPCSNAPDLFFEVDKDSPDDVLSTASRYKMAKALCNDCPIRQQCLHYAIEHKIEHGIWGQTTPLERRFIRYA